MVQEALERLVDRVVLAIRFMAVFTLATGTLVLIGALATSRFQRIREGALLRTLGATRSQLFRIVLAEYFALGAMAAAVAAGALGGRGVGAREVGVRGTVLASAAVARPRWCSGSWR